MEDRSRSVRGLHGRIREVLPDGWGEIAVVFMVRRKRLRVISARPMSRREWKEYTDAQGKAAKADS